MAITLEQKSLMELIVDRVASMQRAVKGALPGNAVLHAEFRCGDPAPTTPAAAVELARAVEPAAREYKALLVNRGVDMASILSLRKMSDDLARLVSTAPVAEPVAEAVAAPADEAGGRQRRAKKK